MVMVRFGPTRCQSRSGIAHARANHTDMAHAHASWHSQACAARSGNICSRQDVVHTPRPRRVRPGAVHSLCTLGDGGVTMREAGSRLGKGAGEGLLRGRAGAGDGAGDPTVLWARSGRRTSGTPCSSPVARLCVNSRWYSSLVVEMWSHLRTTGLTHDQGKQRSRGWGCGVGGMGNAAPGPPVSCWA